MELSPLFGIDLSVRQAAAGSVVTFDGFEGGICQGECGHYLVNVRLGVTSPQVELLNG